MAVNKIPDIRRVQCRDHGLELDALALAEALRLLCQVVQFIHVGTLGHQPVEYGVLAGDLVHSAVLGSGCPDAHGFQQFDGVSYWWRGL